MPKIASLIIFGLLGIGLGQRRDADDQTQEEGRIEEEKPIDDISEEDTLTLKDSPYCASEIKKLCSHKTAKDDYLIIGCLDQAASNGKLVNEQCQHYIWLWKKSQTVSPGQQELAMHKCDRDMVEAVATDCAKYYDEEKGKDNKIIPCLLDYRLDIDPKEYGQCQRFLTDVSLVVFSDYRLVCNFVSNCQTEIEKFECGRENFGTKEWLVPHSQGEVVNCLEEKLSDGKTAGDIGQACQREIVNLAELSADDFQLDRHFYLACRDDRDTFCSEIAAGEGRIYQCLFKNKFNREMSRECAAAIEIREKLIYQSDYDAGYHLHKKCRKTFHQFGCDQDLENNLQMNREFSGLSGLLVCVEHKMKHIHKKDKTPKEIDPECDKELELYRQYLMSDYELSPNVVAHCQREIAEMCKGMRKQGETLHCLMGLETDSNYEISEDCDEALYELIEETEADTDFRVDAKLQAACQPVVKILCGDSMVDDADILQCLLENLHNQVLVAQYPGCRKSLLEVQYFLARDFSYDKHFRKSCAEEADELCGAPDMGLADQEEDLVIPLSLIVKCLYSHTHPSPDDADTAAGRRLSGHCTNQVHRIMKERSMEVELNDELDKNCKAALGEFCSDVDVEKGIEFLCLQEKYDLIKANEQHEDCAEQIEILTGIASQEMDLEQVLFQACEPMVQKFCSTVIQQEDEGQVLGCLINHKNEPEMNDKCKAGVFHFQIISLDSYKLSYAFYKACKSDIKKLCKIDGNQKKSKQEIIQCLSEEKRNSILSDRGTQMSSECQEQVTFELLGEFEDIRLNPNLKKNCLDDVKKYCNTVKEGDGAIMECLRGQEHNLSGSCHRILFKEMALQAQIPSVDYFLMRVCKNEIKDICAGHRNIESVVDCLADYGKQHKDEDSISSSCKKAVRARQLVADKDIRLNPRLEKNCQQDIPNLCLNVLREKTGNDKLSEVSEEKLLEGKIIGCLKEHFVALQQMSDGDHDPSTTLSKKCATHIEKIMAEEAEDFELDPELMSSCGGHGKPLAEDGICSRRKHTEPLECLKKQFMDENLKGDRLKSCRTYVALLIKEAQVDVAVDATLQNACGIDIKTHCSDIDPGHGRRITCLVNQMKHKPDSLQEECLEKLQERQGMWNKARSIDGIGALAVAVQESNHAKYIVGVLAGISAGIMFCGVYIGRLTNNARARKAL